MLLSLLWAWVCEGWLVSLSTSGKTAEKAGAVVLVGERSPSSSSSGTKEGRLVVVARDGGGEVTWVVLSWPCRLKRPNMAAGAEAGPTKRVEGGPELRRTRLALTGKQGWQGPERWRGGEAASRHGRGLTKNDCPFCAVTYLLTFTRSQVRR